MHIPSQLKDGVAGPPTAALVPYTGEASEYWVGLTDSERRRAALVACTQRDAAALWSLTEAYLALHGKAGGGLSRLTRAQYAVGIKRLLTDWAHEDLRKPRRDAAALWLRHMETHGVQSKDGTWRGLKPGSVQVYLAAARMFYAALRWAGATTADPFADVRPAPDKVAKWDKRQPYTDSEVAQLVAAAEPQDALVILLGAHAGLRISEILDLRWEDVDLRRRILVVRHGKGGKLRQVPLSETLVQHLREVASSSGSVLPYRDRKNAWRRLRTVATAAGVPWLGLHALRHTAGTRIYRETESETITAHFLGHQQLETSRIYAKFSDKRLIKVVGTW
jgi:integrase/recombinase XerC